MHGCASEICCLEMFLEPQVNDTFPVKCATTPSPADPAETTFFPSSHSHPQPFGHRTFKGTTGVEGAHGELRPGLPHALRCNGATGMADSSQFAGRRKVFTSAVHGSSWYILFEEDRLLCDLSKV